MEAMEIAAVVIGVAVVAFLIFKSAKSDSPPPPGTTRPDTTPGRTTDMK